MNYIVNPVPVEAPLDPAGLEGHPCYIPCNGLCPPVFWNAGCGQDVCSLCPTQIEP